MGVRSHRIRTTLVLAAVVGMRLVAPSETAPAPVSPPTTVTVTAPPAASAPPPPPVVQPPVSHRDADGSHPDVGQIPAVDPVAQAVAASRLRYPEPGAAEVAVLARHDDFADALAGASLLTWGPMLFTPTGELDATVGDELQRLLPEGATVYLLGGTNALSPAVADAVDAAGFMPVRLAGRGRVDTALQIADEFIARGGDPERLAIARAWGPAHDPTAAWADAIAFAPTAATGRILLLNPTDRVDPAVAAWLDRWSSRDGASSWDKATVLGGEAALSEQVHEELREILTPHGLWVARESGRNRAETALHLRTVYRAFPDGYLVIDGRSEDGWAVGLAAAGLAADHGLAIVMVDGGHLPEETAEAIAPQCFRSASALPRSWVLEGEHRWDPQLRATVEGLAEGRCELVPLRGDPSEHAFLATHRDGSPVRFNPCEPIHYVIRDVEAPATGVEDVHEAFRRVAAATGMTFVFDGTTDEVASWDRPYYQPQRYGDRWAPLIVDWQRPTEANRLSGSAAGRGGFRSRNGVAVTGAVILDATLELSPGFGTGRNWGELLLHEVGHMIGLHHVMPGSGQIMGEGGDHWHHPGVSRYQAGDLEGLRRLGLGAGCLTTPTPS